MVGCVIDKGLQAMLQMQADSFDQFLQGFAQSYSEDSESILGQRSNQGFELLRSLCLGKPKADAASGLSEDKVPPAPQLADVQMSGATFLMDVDL